MSEKIFRVGVIGRTGRGNYGHGIDTVWQLLPQTRIVAVADDDPAGLEAASKRLGTRAAYADYRKMLAAERPDIVAICSRWADAHCEMTLAAAEYHASIYLEKPMARTPAEADRMIAACESAHVKLAVAHQMRVSPVLDLARQRLREGIIGELQEMRGRGKEDRRAGGEDLMVLGTHVFDLMRQFGGDPEWGFGRVTRAGRDITRADVVDGPEGLGPIAGDAIAGAFAFAGGVTGYFGSKKSDEVSGQRFGLDLYGSRGVMSIRAGMEPEVRVAPSLKWTGEWQPLKLPGNATPRDTAGANRDVAADLLDAIANDRPPRASGHHARWTLEMVMALYASQRSGGRVKLPLDRRDHPLTA